MGGGFIFQGAEPGAHVDATMTQNMINNDQVIYDEIIRRPRGLIGYAEIKSFDSWQMQRAISNDDYVEFGGQFLGRWDTTTSYSPDDIVVFPGYPGTHANNGAWDGGYAGDDSVGINAVHYQAVNSSTNRQPKHNDGTIDVNWKRISAGRGAQSWQVAAHTLGTGRVSTGPIHIGLSELLVEVETEDNRLIRVEAMIPHLETVAVGLTHQNGVRIVRDGSYVVGQPVADHWWGGYPVPDRRGVWIVGFDFPDAGPHTYAVEINNGGAVEPTYNVGSMQGRERERYQATGTDTPYEYDIGEAVAPSQIMVFDMGDTSGMTLPEQTGDSRTRDPISTAKATEITKNLRRQRGKKDHHRGF